MKNIVIFDSFFYCSGMLNIFINGMIKYEEITSRQVAGKVVSWLELQFLKVAAHPIGSTDELKNRV